MVSPLRTVFVRTPTTVGEFVADGHWREPRRELLESQHSEFVELLRGLGSTVLVGEPVEGLVDAVYTHDPAVMTPFGAVLLQMRKPVRRPEPGLMRSDFERLGVPVLGSVHVRYVSATAGPIAFKASTPAVATNAARNAYSTRSWASSSTTRRRMRLRKPSRVRAGRFINIFIRQR